MAFTGVAVVTQVSDNLIRVTGLSLAGAAAGTIGLAEGAGEVDLPASFKPRPFGTSSLIESIEVSMVPVTSVTTLVPIMVVKTGATLAAFLMTFTNTTAATASAEVEIYIRFH